MRKFKWIALFALFALNTALAEDLIAQYGVQFVAPFNLYNTDGTLDIDEVDGGTEVSVRCQGGSNTTATNDFVDRGSDYEITLTASEMQCATVIVTVAATTTEVFRIVTTNNASAALPQLNANVTQYGGTNGTFSGGRPEVNTSHISGDSGAADELELALDGSTGAAESFGIARQGTAQAATSTTIQLDTGASFGDDTVNGMTVVACGSTQGYCQSRAVTDYVNSTDTATVDTWSVTPSGTVTYYLFATAPGAAGVTAADVWAYSTRTITALDEDSTTLDLDATTVGTVNNIASGGITNASFATTAGAFNALGIVDQGTAQAVTGTTIRLRSAATFADDELNGAIVLITGGSTGVGQTRTITDYTSSTDTATVGTWTTTPTGTITYEVIAWPSLSLIAASDVWNFATRSLTVFDEDSTTLDLDTTIRAAVGLTTSNLDSQLTAIDDYVDTEVAAILDDTGTSGVVLANDAITAAKIAADAIGSSELAATAVNELRDIVIEDQGGGVTLACAIAVILAYASGDLATTGSDSTYEEPSGTETRITGTVTSVGNRTATITCPTL